MFYVSIECTSSGGDDFVNRSNTDLHCYYFYFTYFIFCGGLMFFAILFTYFMSIRYMRSLAHKGMQEMFFIKDGPGKGANGNDVEFMVYNKPCCNIYGKPYIEKILENKQTTSSKIGYWQNVYESLGWGLSTYTQQQYIWCLHHIYISYIEEISLKNLQQFSNSQRNSRQSSSADEVLRSSIYQNKHNQQKSALQRLLIQFNNNHGEYSHKIESLKNKQPTFWNSIFSPKKSVNREVLLSPRIPDPRRGGPNYEIPDNDNIDLDSIFFFHRPKLFFLIVDILFLFNTFYSAIYFTQALPTCVYIGAPGWGFILSLPMIFGFIFLRATLLRSVFLQAVTVFDEDMAGAVIEETIDTLTIADTVRQRILTKLDSNENSSKNRYMTNDVKFKIIDYCFISIDSDKSGSIDKTEFRSFLGKLELFLRKEKFYLLWRYLDIDNSGTLSRDEILIFLFPELKNNLKNTLYIVQTIRHRVRIMNWSEDYIKTEIFDAYDRDCSNSIDINELKAILSGPKFGLLQISDSGYKVLFAAIETDGNGKISWEEFLNLCFVFNILSDDGNQNLRQPKSRSFINNSNNSNHNTTTRNSMNSSTNARNSMNSVTGPSARRNSMSLGARNPSFRNSLAPHEHSNRNSAYNDEQIMNNNNNENDNNDNEEEEEDDSLSLHSRGVVDGEETNHDTYNPYISSHTNKSSNNNDAYSSNPHVSHHTNKSSNDYSHNNNNNNNEEESTYHNNNTYESNNEHVPENDNNNQEVWNDETYSETASHTAPPQPITASYNQYSTHSDHTQKTYNTQNSKNSKKNTGPVPVTPHTQAQHIAAAADRTPETPDTAYSGPTTKVPFRPPPPRRKSEISKITRSSFSA